ncbi:hypothetical protein HK100_006865, partial [Physocladia obscura]
MLERFESSHPPIDHTRPDSPSNSDSNSDFDAAALADQFSGLDLETMPIDKVLALVPETYLKAFESDLKSGKILESDAFSEAITKPWWLPMTGTDITSKLVQELSSSSSLLSDTENFLSPSTANPPVEICDIPPFSSLSKLPPHTSLPFNLVELLCIYSIIWRRFNGDFSDTHDNQLDICSLTCSLSLVLMDQAAAVSSTSSISTDGGDISSN